MRKIIHPIKFNQNKNWIFLGLFIVLIYLLPNIINDQSARYLIHDNLDSNVVRYKSLVESDCLYSYNRECLIENSLGGIQRELYPSEFKLLIVIYSVFPVELAYNLNVILLHLIAFFGMYLLSKKYLFDDLECKYLFSSLLAVCFAVLPFWPSAGMTIAGQPLIIWSILNILRREKLIGSSFIIIIVYPLYSSLVLGNLFFLLFVSIFLVQYFIKNKKIDYWIIVVLIGMGLISIASEFRLFRLFLEGFKSHRDTFVLNNFINWKGVIGVSAQLFLKGQYHFFARTFPLFPIIGGLGLLFAVKKDKKRLIILFALGILCALLSVLRDNKLIIEAVPFFQKFNPRFYSLLPMIWFLVLGISIRSIYSKLKRNKVVIIIPLIAIVLSNFTNWFSSDYTGGAYLENSFYSTYLNKEGRLYSTFNEIYTPKLYQKLKNKFKLKNERILCVDLLPESAQFNDLKTVGGYYVFWPYEYCEIISSIKGLDEVTCSNKCYFTSEDIASEYFSLEKLKESNVSFVISSKYLSHKMLKLECELNEGTNQIIVYTID